VNGARARRWLQWVALTVVVMGALVLGAQGQHHDPNIDAHVRRVASQVRCPTCSGQSVADSNAASSQAIRDDIRTRIQEGQSDGAIRSFLVSRYGSDILLNPPASGVSGLVWALPVMGFIIAIGGLGLAFRRWRAHGDVEVTEADEALVEQALRGAPAPVAGAAPAAEARAGAGGGGAGA
jgi:cytochrome c-type biogenesis protein CcmH